MRILAHRQMSQNPDGLPGRGQLIIAGEGNEDLVPNTADIDNRLRRQGVHEFAVEKRDHGER